MPYLIDANNLAGKLDLLNEADFDQKLIKIIKKYIKRYNKKITLVFEGRDPMGDKLIDGNLTIIRAPRDDYYKNADVKIIELIRTTGKPEQLVVITDDREILKAAEQAGCQLKKASYFAGILHSYKFTD
ncbi:NYN domain-containing protein [Candidatus Parcubacteria bacterium]|nr:NYN domain-containing protein [Candidatus Parcubacteria bacterium]